MNWYEEKRAFRNKFDAALESVRAGRLTPSVVSCCLDCIRRIDGGDEEAHSMEKELWGAVLSAIAEDRCDDPKECARLARTSSEIEFSRWYA